MRSVAVSLVVLSVSTLPAFGQQSTCYCPEPPGGVGNCEGRQVAVCRVVNGQCSTLCRSYENLGATGVAAQLIADITMLPPDVTGFSADGSPVNYERSEISFDMLSGILNSQDVDQTQYQVTVDPVFIREASERGFKLDRTVFLSIPKGSIDQEQDIQVPNP